MRFARIAEEVTKSARLYLSVASIGVSAVAAQADTAPPNILLIIADDLGVEQLAPFGIGSAPATTPVLDQLARDGIRFSHTWAQPVCSPSRATMLTGRYSFRTGVGGGVAKSDLGPKPDLLPGPDGAVPEGRENLRGVFRVLGDYINLGQGGARKGPSEDEVTLAHVLKEDPGYRTAAIGKWHLADTLNGGLMHASVAGFDHFELLMENQPESYSTWLENSDGSYTAKVGYTAEAKVDAALDWINAPDAEEPWFMWFAFNLPHYPLHVPAGMDIDNPRDPHQVVDAMIAKMDTEIGRLLDGLDPDQRDNTYIIFVGDNGTTPSAIDPPFRREGAKFTVFEGGLRVPLIIVGPGVPADTEVGALVNTTDIFGTVLDLAGADTPPHVKTDSVSLVPYFEAPDASLREFAFAEHFTNWGDPKGGGYAFRDDRWKLIRTKSIEALFDLEADPYETIDLLADGTDDVEAAIVARLTQHVETLWASDP